MKERAIQRPGRWLFPSAAILVLGSMLTPASAEPEEPPRLSLLAGASFVDRDAEVALPTLAAWMEDVPHHFDMMAYFGGAHHSDPYVHTSDGSPLWLVTGARVGYKWPVWNGKADLMLYGPNNTVTTFVGQYVPESVFLRHELALNYKSQGSGVGSTTATAVEFTEAIVLRSQSADFWRRFLMLGSPNITGALRAGVGARHWQPAQSVTPSGPTTPGGPDGSSSAAPSSQVSSYAVLGVDIGGSALIPLWISALWRIPFDGSGTDVLFMGGCRVDFLFL